jgi:hypothetical protein
LVEDVLWRMDVELEVYLVCDILYVDQA